MDSIGFFIGVLIMGISELYVMSCFYSLKLDFRCMKYYVALLLFVVFSILNYTYISAFIRMIFAALLLVACNWILFRKKILETLICSLYTHFLVSVSDTLGVLIVLAFVGNVDFIKLNVFGSLLGNAIVALLLVLISKVFFVRKIYLKLVDYAYNLKIKNLFNLFILMVVSINFLLAIMYYKINPIYIIVINLVLLFIYSYIVYRIINEKNNSVLVRAENDSLMHSLHQYEDMVDRQRIDNHENKNQLLIIRNMIKKNDKDVVNYIDTVVKDQKEDDEVLYTRVMTIPSGGLQGIIYQKMLVMKDEKIQFSLDVSRDVREIDLDCFSMEDNYRLCRIVGVLLDNAIDASRRIDDKCIMISLYIDDDLFVIDISNRFIGEIDIDKLDDDGYTTKGDGRGYGLSLVKKLLSESNVFLNEKSIKNNVFKQVVKVRIKNT